MKKWVGAAGLCVNKRGEILMVKQGRPDERKKWSILLVKRKQMKRLKNVV